MEAEKILGRLKENFGAELNVQSPSPYGVVKPEQIRDVILFLKDDPDMRFDYPGCLSGVDDGKNFWVVYHLYSMAHNHDVTVKVMLPREDPHIASVTDLYPGMNWHERETYDMFGIIFDGHPDLRRILLAEDWEGFPLRKDYKFPEYYQDIPLI